MARESWTILDILASALFGYLVSLPDDLDWMELYEESVSQAVFPLVYSVVEDRIPSNMREMWDEDFYQYIASNMRVNFEHAELHSLMKQAGIPYVVIKGEATEGYYPNPQLRSMGDVDFIVKESDIERTARVVESAGFSLGDESLEHEAHFTYMRDPDSIWEMHWSLAGIPDGALGDVIRATFEDIIETSHMDDYAMVPDDFHHGIILLEHTAIHLTNTGIGLRHFCDWAVFVDKVEDFEGTFKETLQACGLWRFAQLLTQLSTKYLHMPGKDWALENVDGSLLEAMMSDIMESGNFGEKDSERINQAKFMIDMKSGHIDGKSMPRKFISLMNKKARETNLILPIGWVYVGGRHLIRIIKGKRPAIHAGETLKGARKRRNIYKEFHLYE